MQNIVINRMFSRHLLTERKQNSFAFFFAFANSGNFTSGPMGWCCRCSCNLFVPLDFIYSFHFLILGHQNWPWLSGNFCWLNYVRVTVVQVLIWCLFSFHVFLVSFHWHFFLKLFLFLKWHTLLDVGSWLIENVIEN